MPETPATPPATPPADNGAAKPAEAQPWTPPARDEWEKVQAALKQANAEAAQRRHAEKEAAEKAAAAEKAKAEAEGRWGDVVKLERERAAQVAAEAEAAKKRVAELEPFAAVVAAEVQSLRTTLGDKAAAVAGLPDAQALPILRTIQALAAGKPAAPAPASAHPAPHATPADLAAMSPEDRRKHIASLTHEQRRALAGAQSSAPPWLRR